MAPIHKRALGAYTKIYHIAYSYTDIGYKIIMNKNMRCNLTIRKDDKSTPHWALHIYVCRNSLDLDSLTKDCRLRLL